MARNTSGGFTEYTIHRGRDAEFPAGDLFLKECAGKKIEVGRTSGDVRTTSGGEPLEL